MSKTACKWMPVFSDACQGCGLCVKSCQPNRCIELVWDFAALQRPEDCGSCGACEEVCPHGGIRMDWVKTTGSPLIGQWREAPELPEAPTHPRHWLWGIFG